MTFHAASTSATGRRMLKLRPVRDRAVGPIRRLDAVGLDRAGCSSSSSSRSRSCIRRRLDAGNLREQVRRAHLRRRGDSGARRRSGRAACSGAQPAADEHSRGIPRCLGDVTVAKTVPQLKAFVEGRRHADRDRELDEPRSSSSACRSATPSSRRPRRGDRPLPATSSTCRARCCARRWTTTHPLA